MNNKKRAAVSALIGSLTGAAAALLMLLLLSFFITRVQTVPYEALPMLSVAAICPGAFAGGWLSARLNRSAGMLLGAVAGAGAMLLLLAAGAASGSEIGVAAILRLSAAVLSGAIGGVLGVNRRKKKKR